MKEKQGITAKQKPVTGNVGFDVLCLAWLKEVRVEVKESTYADYYDKVHNHIIPPLGKLKAKMMGVDLINQFVREKVEHGRLDGKGGLSAKTVHDIVSVLVQIIRYGEGQHKIPAFQEERLILPKIQEKELPVLTEGEQRQLEAFLSGKPNLETLGLFLVLYSGLRIGELCALTWRDIDTEEGLLHVNKTLQRIKNVDGNSPFKTKVIIDMPKSKKSVRTIPIMNSLLIQLKREKAKYLPDAFFLTGKVRKFIEPRVYSEKFKRYLEASRVDDINFHALRHPHVKHTTKIFSLRLMDFQAQAYPDARRKTRGACQLHQGGQSRSPVRLLCNRKQLSCLPPQSKMSWILYAISMRLSGYTSTRSISSSASSVVSVSASKITLDASLRLSCRACSSCFCFACANTAA